MTTKVIVSSPKNNHQAVKVECVAKNSTGQEVITSTTNIPDGEDRSFYVHGGCQLRITEVPKP